MTTAATPLLTRLADRSKDLRRTIVETLRKGKRGHVGAAYSLVEILRVLYDDVLKFDAPAEQAARLAQRKSRG